MKFCIVRGNWLSIQSISNEAVPQDQKTKAGLVQNVHNEHKHICIVLSKIQRYASDRTIIRTSSTVPNVSTVLLHKSRT